MEPVSERKIPAWGWCLMICCQIVGVAELFYGNYFWGVVLIGGAPFGFALRLYRRRRGPQPPTDTPADVEDWLLRWIAGFGVAAGACLAYGAVALPGGIGLVVVGLAPAYLGMRFVQYRQTVKELADLAEREGFGALVVLVGREPTLEGLACRGWVIGVDEARLAIARASFRQAEWEIRPLTEVSRFEAHLKHPSGGDLRYADGARNLHLMGILARPLVSAERLVSAARR